MFSPGTSWWGGQAEPPTGRSQATVGERDTDESRPGEPLPVTQGGVAVQAAGWLSSLNNGSYLGTLCIY